jgi:hypothetical protein
VKLEDREMQELHDKNLHLFGRAALPRRPRIQGRAATLPCQQGEDYCHAPKAKLEWAIP